MSGTYKNTAVGAVLVKALAKPCTNVKSSGAANYSSDNSEGSEADHLVVIFVVVLVIAVKL